MPGFAQPSALLVAAPSQQDRDFIASCARALAPHFQRWVEPCAGAFAIPATVLQCGFDARQVECSDVNLFTTVCGYVAAGKPLGELQVRVDGQLLDTDGDQLDAGALILYTQLVLRMACRPDNDYWSGIRKDLAYRRDTHLATIRQGLEQHAERFRGFEFFAECMWDHMERVKDDPGTIISLSPPTYAAGYEKFFATDGRLEWAEPAYQLFDPADGFERLYEEAQGWKALVLCIQEEYPVDWPILYSRDVRKDVLNRVWSNQHDRVLDLTGLAASARGASTTDRLDAPIIPPDHPITEQSTVQLVKISSSASRHYKDLWVHRITPMTATSEFAVLIDGYMAGLGGLSPPPPQTAHNQRGNLLFMYGPGAPHELRIGRLITGLALTWSTLRLCFNEWVLADTERIITAEMTRHPESKGMRGLMKLRERKKDPEHGYRLIYVAEPNDKAPQQVLRDWLRSERQSVKARTRQSKAAKRRQREEAAA